MCGITGFLTDNAPPSLDQMTACIKHRGPDDQGTWQQSLPDDRRLGLGCCRLAIQDVSSAGHMPMHTPDEQLTIVYNGETYNYPALRKKLSQKGYQFRSDSDTEAVLYAYREYGKECVHHMKGMFSFAIWNQETQSLFLARDRFGIKPLYYYRDNDLFSFASEIKSLLKIPDIPRKLDPDALHQYLTFLWVPEPDTMLRGIKKLPAGHYASISNQEMTMESYWDLSFPDTSHSYSRDEEALAGELRERFMDTVEQQLISDVPVGAYLSAGLDSSGIVAGMAEATQDPVKTFTITFPEEYREGSMILDDPAVAQRTADTFGCDHTELVVEPDVVDLLPKLTWHMDEPVADPALITSYLVSRKASESVKVLLSGVGGDELFAGYRKYLAHDLARIYQWIPETIRKYVLEPGVQSLPPMRGTPLKGYIRLMKKMARSGSLPPRDRFIMDSIYLDDREKQQLYQDDFLQKINQRDPRIKHLQHFDQVQHTDFLNQMLYVDCKTFMPGLNLLYNDKTSMASSVEVRVPFLDHELAEWTAQNIPPEYKLNGSTTKHIFRKAMNPVLPDEVLQQKKAGFAAPIDHWLANDLQEMVGDLLSPARLQQRGLFDPDTVETMIDQHQSGKKDHAFPIWQLLTLEHWMQTFLDR